jgi:hypothetical protein
MPGEKGLLDEFLKTLHEDRLEALIQRVMQVPEGRRVRATRSMADSLCELVRLVWDKMQLAGEAGSLLKIEEELQEAIRTGQQEWEEKQPLFRITEFSLREEPKDSYLRFVPGAGVSFWEPAESLVMAALHDFSTFAGNGGKLQRRLFVEDAVQGFAFVDLCRKRFDVALMNPPFGEASKPSKGLIEEAVPTHEERRVRRLRRTGTQPAEPQWNARSDHVPYRVLPLVLPEMAGRSACRECRSYRVCRSRQRCTGHSDGRDRRLLSTERLARKRLGGRS